MRRTITAIVVMFGLYAVTAGLVTAQSRFLGKNDRPMFTRYPADTSVLAPAGTVTNWTGHFTFNDAQYTYTMVGTDPLLGAQTTTVPTVIVPLRFVFADGTVLDPTQPACNSGSSAVTSTIQSPIFQSATYAPGGTNVGTTQYVDAYQRANFWNFVSPTPAAIELPEYHVLLSQPSVTPTQTINVPAAFGTTVEGPCARIGKVGIAYFQIWLRTHIGGITGDTLPIFLTYNTFFTQAGGCCILGFHTAYGRAPNQLTVSVAAYSDPGIFSVPIQDIHALSHEIGEWMDDPYVNNIVPPWSGGQVSGCSSFLENGDPVTGIAFEVTMNGQTYHPEDLVFLSWFARQSPSTAVNGWYTFLNSYSSPPAVCN